MIKKKIRRAHKRREYNFIFGSLFTLFFLMIFTKGYTPFVPTGNNVYHIYVNGQPVGTIENGDDAQHLLIEARREIAARSDNLLFMSGTLKVEGEELLFGTVDDEETVKKAMEEVLRGTISETIQSSVTVKINEYMVNLNNLNEAQTLLQTALDQYDTSGNFVVSLEKNYDRAFSLITPVITNTAGENAEETEETSSESEEEVSLFPEGGIASYIADLGLQEIATDEELDFSDYELGVTDMGFEEEIEISEGYLPRSQVTGLAEAIEYVTKEQEAPGEYTIQSGDTLSAISINVNIPMETLVELNPDKLDSVNAIIHEGDVLTITVPEPELSVERIEREYVEEVYDAPVQYVENDDWYTTQTRILQQPSSGFRKAIVDVHYINDSEISKTTVKEELVVEAVPKIVEIGTQTPPTYIKPISGGTISSYFGYRKSPGGIGSTYHKGVDWYVPRGTPVYASSGGTVTKAGWGSGYGYVVYISHPDGRETRYAHLSSTVAYVGQYVSQGQLIAYSGSTGNSTGPHLHFEILINGVQVNPLDYL